MKVSKNKYLLSIVVSCIATIFFTMLFYNIEFIFNYFNLSSEIITSFDIRIITYILMFICFFILFLTLKRIFKIADTIALLISSIPVIILDSTTLITGRNLIPLRFPFATLFPILGCIAGYIYVSKRGFIYYLLLFSVFFYLSHTTFIPYLKNYILNKEAISINIDSFHKSYFLNKDSNTVKLNDLLIEKCTLLDFYFIGCRPCEQKFSAITELTKRNKRVNLRTIYICDGNINSFSQFKNFQREKDSVGIYLYDYDNQLKQIINVSTYPFEIFLINKKIILTETGYDAKNGLLYINKRQEKINEVSR